jgi:hypothetical protein
VGLKRRRTHSIVSVSGVRFRDKYPSSMSTAMGFNSLSATTTILSKALHCSPPKTTNRGGAAAPVILPAAVIVVVDNQAFLVRSRAGR